MKYYKNQLIILSVLTIFAFGLNGCEDTVKNVIDCCEPPTENEPPVTTMANVPVEGDTLFANVTLHWDGGDNDGFVDHYEWMYSTVSVQTGDTLQKTNWMETDKTSLTITFSSPEELNKQIFKVRAIDNKGLEADTIGRKMFYTEQTVPPEVNIAEPQNNTRRFYQEQATDWYQGIRIIYEGEDEDGEIEEYGWAVNDGEYTWTSDTTVVIPPGEFDPERGNNQIILTARDDTDLTSSDPDTINVTLIKPTFDKGILVIDETVEDSKYRNSTGYNDGQVDSVYDSWINPTTHENWDYQDKGMPSREVLGQYKMVFWHADNWYGSSADAHEIGNHKQILSEYMNVGGDFIMSGWKILKSLRPAANYPITFTEGDFELDYLHIKRAGSSGNAPPGEFVGANGVGEYNDRPDERFDITIDSSKVNGYPASFYSNMVDVNLVMEAAGFTSPIYTFGCRTDCGEPTLRGTTIAVRYFGTSFDAVVFGFPISFMKSNDAERIVDKILTNMGYRGENEKTIR